MVSELLNSAIQKIRERVPRPPAPPTLCGSKYYPKALRFLREPFAFCPLGLCPGASCPTPFLEPPTDFTREETVLFAHFWDGLSDPEQAMKEVWG